MSDTKNISLAGERTHPTPGETRFDDVAPSRELAEKLCAVHYDCAEPLEYSKDKGGAFYAVKVGRWYKAMIGNINGRLAILHKHDDGSRTLEVVTPA